MIILSEFIWMVIKSSLLSIGLSMLIIFIICTLFFKSWKFGFLSILPLASAVIVNFGLMGLLGHRLNTYDCNIKLYNHRSWC